MDNKKHILRHFMLVATMVVASCCVRVHAQSTIIHGYEFTTGVDSSLWYDMNTHANTPWILASRTDISIPFPFFMWDRNHTNLSIYMDGTVSFPPLFLSSGNPRPYSYFPDVVDLLGQNINGIFGNKCHYTRRPYQPIPPVIHFRTADYTEPSGHRVFVVQTTGYNSNLTAANLCQVQLREADNSITLIYGEDTHPGNPPTSIGLMFDTAHLAIINPDSHTVSSLPPTEVSGSWPGQYRYYRFTPTEHFCPIPYDVTSELVWNNDNDIRVLWGGSPFYNTFRVEYGPTGFAEGTGTSLLVNGNSAVIHDIHTTAETEARVYTQCTHGESEYANTTFTTCPVPFNLSIGYSSISNNNMILTWDYMPRHHGYRVEYGPAGFAEGTGTSLTVNAPPVELQDVTGNEDFEARVYALCTYGESDYASIPFHPSCNPPGYRMLHYDYLSCIQSVKCCTGTFYSPANSHSPQHLVDSGSSSSLSRHTIHYDTSERDPRTDGQLRTVPQGFCSSVRLGNWLGGAEQEAIFYTLDIDTNEYDLLILRYAIVEQNPNHLERDQPRFIFNITDTSGEFISNCYFGNFVSGDLSGWNTLPTSSMILWHDWDVVGVDLAPLHGRTILVSLSNYDCSLGGHFGYGYFTLQTGTKRILAQSCGNRTENTFSAPEGFSYRWYNMEDTATTLSTSRSLHVTQEGLYGCQVSYQLSDQVCSFNLSTYAGGRYPLAAFSMQPLDSCGYTTRFVNQSCIARDEARTQLTSFPCDEYLWVVDDSITYTSTDITHQFEEGTHTVTLYALLAGGTCTDSVSETFTVSMQHDTVHASICQGSSYNFFGRELTDSGEYHHIANCLQTVLYLQTKPVYNISIQDTLLLGEHYMFNGTILRQPGVYTSHLTALNGCDSTVTLHLNCINILDTTICSSDLPLVWHRHIFTTSSADTLHLFSTSVNNGISYSLDSMVVLRVRVLQPPELSLQPIMICSEPGGYLMHLPDTLCYRWTATPADSSLPTGWVTGNQLADPLLLSPGDTTTYYLTTNICNSIPCPRYDTLILTPVAIVDARLEVTPQLLNAENMTLTAIDLSPQPHQRQWYFNSALSSETDSIVHYYATTTDDSVRVMLMVNTDDCADSATASVAIKVQTIWFPNVFTPDQPTNNIFKGYGIKVKDYELAIYTRWGQRIFYTTDINEGWNGTYHGIESPVSAYTYICNYTTLDGEHLTLCGTVTLLR